MDTVKAQSIYDRIFAIKQGDTKAVIDLAMELVRAKKFTFEYAETLLDRGGPDTREKFYAALEALNKE